MNTIVANPIPYMMLELAKRPITIPTEKKNENFSLIASNQFLIEFPDVL